ncbi:pilus assembly FimT family protein [Gloeobacter kilaueensis]|uniref:Methylation site containing protein n=1 Tax=Gloeobacter kilaueensis (strain ATCC BAA-2537 / CCAP 1431/1 / ULC 316 / JS1) TaxID=1183438 RepID=U5QIX2_GLOK1|nr:prepilin-type N-terminal cleavage/methylation domain-containing protein [Gloeobacter kilaueensis]AGY58851.1 methylation site containing protein [Gloeobacter kilaueensis JS1]
MMRTRYFQLQRRNTRGFTLFEMVIVLAALAVLGGVVATTTVGVTRDANVEATTQGVETMSQWRSQIATANQPGTTNCWNNANLDPLCAGYDSPGDPTIISVPSLLNEGKPMFWPVVKAPWSAVCDQARYPDHYRRVTTILGECSPGWDSAYPLNSTMDRFVANLAKMRL